ncbi:hypothetical protein BJX63DRAFT_382692 [Aspergillus granulosus]|uniref:Uncharacterized protein n=1 Tax=Aspergillus granulosus TaxID=176169 RepID=A0ABR4HUP6_9EURO
MPQASYLMPHFQESTRTPVNYHVKKMRAGSLYVKVNLFIVIIILLTLAEPSLLG